MAFWQEDKKGTFLSVDRRIAIEMIMPSLTKRSFI